MILLPFEVCPVCQVQKKDNYFNRQSFNSGWWEKRCSNFGICAFHQYFFTSYEDQEIQYFAFRLADFSCSVHGENDTVRSMRNKTYFYPGNNGFPGMPSGIISPFQIWENYMPDFTHLDKLNQKLKNLLVFL